MVIIYSILFNIMSEIDDGLEVIYILYAAHGYNIYIYCYNIYIYYFVIIYIYILFCYYYIYIILLLFVYIYIILLLDGHHEMCLGFSVAKKLPQRHVQMSRRPLPQKRLKQREEKAYSCLFQHVAFVPQKPVKSHRDLHFSIPFHDF